MKPIAIRDAFCRSAATIAVLLVPYTQSAWSAPPVGREFVVEPDDYAHAQELNTISPHVTLSTGAFSDNRPTFDVVSYTDAADASTGTKVFAHAGGIPFWNTNRTFRMDFHSLVTRIQLDYVGSGFFDNSYQGRLEAYSSTGVLLDSYLTAPLAEGQFETMTVEAPQIAWALAYPPEDPFGDLDYLRFTVVPEPGTVALVALAAWGGVFVRRRRSSE
jgi:hypothetical protein